MKENPFDAAAKWVQAQLESSGFERPPKVPEPELPASLEDIESVSGLKRLYDEYLHYYNHVAGLLVRLKPMKDLIKLRASTVQAEATLRAKREHGDMTADLRKAAVECDTAYVGAKLEEVKVTGLVHANDERRKTASKILDRIGRELYYRTGRTQHQDSSNNKSGRPWTGHQHTEEPRQRVPTTPRTPVASRGSPPRHRPPRPQKASSRDYEDR